MSLFGYNLHAVAGVEDRHHQATQSQMNGPLSRTSRPSLSSPTRRRACMARLSSSKTSPPVILPALAGPPPWHMRIREADGLSLSGSTKSETLLIEECRREGWFAGRLRHVEQCGRSGLMNAPWTLCFHSRATPAAISP